MIEVLRSLPGFEETHSVSDLGRVCRLEHTIMRSNGRKQIMRSKIIKGAPDTHGHIQVRICGKLYLLHRLIALTFIGPCPAGMEVCHDDGIAGNARLSNLRYDTHAGNMADRNRHGTEARGSEKKLAKLTEATALDALLRSKAGESNASIARYLGVNSSTISVLISRKTWTHVHV